MKILILGLNYAPEPVGISVYTTGMAEALAEQGHEVEVVCGQPYYPGWAVMKGYGGMGRRRSTEAGIGVTRVPLYVPARPSGLRRLLHHLSFAMFALLPMLLRAALWRPQVVMAVAPSLLSAPVAALAARLCGAGRWLHVQDLEVEVAFVTGLFKEGGGAARLARWFEQWMLAGFDLVSAVSPAMCRKLLDKGVRLERVREFRNWTDTEVIKPLAQPSRYRAAWGITAPHVALYAGSLGNKQGIEKLVEAARLLRHRTDIVFVICGEGEGRRRLEQQIADEPNIVLHDLQPRERLAELMGLASVHLLPQVAGTQDLLLPSKLTNMLASGRPVVAMAEEGSCLAMEVEGAGLVVPPGNAPALAAAIERIADNADLAAAMGSLARQRAEQRWSRSQALASIAACLEDLERVRRTTPMPSAARGSLP